MISAIGGTLGLFTGISVITFVEVIYWMIKFMAVFVNSAKLHCLTIKENMIKAKDSATRSKRGKFKGQNGVNPNTNYKDEGFIRSSLYMEDVP